MRVDLGPLLHPVGADFQMSPDEAALESLRPSHARTHGCKGGVNVSRVEGRVRRAKQVSFQQRLIWHEWLPEALRRRTSLGVDRHRTRSQATAGASVEPFLVYLGENSGRLACPPYRPLPGVSRGASEPARRVARIFPRPAAGPSHVHVFVGPSTGEEKSATGPAHGASSHGVKGAAIAAMRLARARSE